VRSSPPTAPPFPESTLTLLLRQGADVDLLLRMMAGEFRTERQGGKVTYANKPADRDGYTTFRRVALHLSAIQDRGALYAEPMIFTESWIVAADSVTPEVLQSLDGEFTVTREPSGFRLTKRTVGRIVVTNYDPVLSNAERRALHDEAERNLEDELVVDIRPATRAASFGARQFPPPQLRQHDRLPRPRARRGPEYDVAPHSRTPSIRRTRVHSPRRVVVPLGAGTRQSASRALYALRPEEGYQWNKKAFVLLYQLFQMTVVRPAETGPGITIAK
jgi:hypothetical protein